MSVAGNLEIIRERIQKACLLSGRNVQDVRLIAVSKFHSVENIEEALANGQADFAENYFQEWRAKAEILERQTKWPPIAWHMIGHLQSRKANGAAGKFALIHTLDSEKLALSLQKALERENLHQNALVEINIAEEPQKTGISRKNLLPFCEFVQEKCPRLALRGLMCMPPFSETGAGSQKYFAQLRRIRDELEKSLGRSLPELSMGMSGDFEAAIQEGATIVRIGSAIFGPRPARGAKIGA